MRAASLSTAIAICLTLLAVTARLLPHPANFAPVVAVTLFGGAVLPRRVAVLIPLLAMVLSDAIIGFYTIMPIIWACYAAIALASVVWLRQPNVQRVVGIAIASSLFFFVVTNFAVWLFDGMYAHTWAGLIQCYVMALPFFRNSFLSDLLYTGALFTSWAMACQVAARYFMTGQEAR